MGKGQLARCSWNAGVGIFGYELAKMHSYLFYAVNFHIWVIVHPPMTVRSHSCGSLLDGPVAAVAHKADNGYNHRQHCPARGGTEIVGESRSRYDRMERETQDRAHFRLG